MFIHLKCIRREGAMTAKVFKDDLSPSFPRKRESSLCRISVMLNPRFSGMTGSGSMIHFLTRESLCVFSGEWLDQRRALPPVIALTLFPRKAVT